MKQTNKVVVKTHKKTLNVDLESSDNKCNKMVLTLK